MLSLQKHPSWNRECNLTFIFKHSYIGIHKGCSGNGCTRRKLYIHWVRTASDELIQAAAPEVHPISQPRSVRSYQATQARHPIPSEQPSQGRLVSISLSDYRSKPAQLHY